MEVIQDVKKLILEGKNVCIIPSQENEPESLTAALALFYTLKELGKNVNLIVENVPEKINFLIPSLDFIDSPKNFVISIPRNITDVSQIYYEKNEEALKIHLTIDRGHLKKEHISFYSSNAKPDLVITLGIKDFQSQLTERLDSFGFILDTPIINIDNHKDNTQFGAINLVNDYSLSQTTMDLIGWAGQDLISKNVANCLLAGLIIYYENLKSPKTTHEVFQMCSDLIKKGAENQKITEHLYRMTRREMHFFSNIFQNLRTADNYEGSFAMLDSNEFLNFGEHEASFAVEKMKTMGIQSDMLVLWRSHASDPMIKGFFYSKKPTVLDKVTKDQQGAFKNDWVFLSIPGSNVALVKDKIMESLYH